ncbi:MAG: HutD family protein, partial [Rubrivivax sp.]
HIVRLQEATAQPWRTGGGVTRELLAWSAPEGLVHEGAARASREASAEDWDLRVSVADITQDGPFSAFPGISRCFAVLEGAGVVLNLRGQAQTLSPASEPLAFDGAEAPGCRLVSGPTRDLNLMARHSAGLAWMQRAVAGQLGPPDTPPQPTTSGQKVLLQEPPSQGWCTPFAWYGLYTHSPAVLDTPGGRITLPAGSLAWSDASLTTTPELTPSAPWRLVDGAQAWWLGLLVGSARAAGMSQAR